MLGLLAQWGGLVLPALASAASINISPDEYNLPAVEMSKTSTAPLDVDNIRSGWVSGPDGRGTFDIISSCTFTIFVCSWSVLCLNVPAQNENQWKVLRRKCYLTGLGILGPEFLLQISLGQWIAARASVKQYHRSGFSDWSMMHAFFANMGGIVLQPHDWKAFPVDAEQLHYLIERSYVAYPKIDKRSIEDKNKVEPLLRVISVVQILWFLCHALARVCQGLAVTTIEVTTVAFIFCTLGTYFLWFHKPADIRTPLYIHLRPGISITDILLQAGDRAQRPYSRTPLDFVSKREWFCSQWWSFGMNILRKLHIVFAPRVRPIDRIPNDLHSVIPPRAVAILGAMDLIYAAIHVSAWNTHFASSTERFLWRLSSVTMTVSVSVVLVVEALQPLVRKFSARPDQILPEKQRHPENYITKLDRWRYMVPMGRPVIDILEVITRFSQRIAKRLRNNSLNKDPDLYLPLKQLIPFTAAAAVYCVVRAYILLEDILSLRELPESAYRTVDWQQLLL